MPQGYPLDMIAYGIGILLIICELCNVHPQVTQPWYADNTGKGGESDTLQEHMQEFLVRVSPQGYLPGPTKSILVVSLQNVQRAEEHFWAIRMRVVTGSRYLGGLIGDQELEKEWLVGKMTGWTDLVEGLAGLARRHP